MRQERESEKKKSRNDPGSPRLSRRKTRGIDLHNHSSYSPDSRLQIELACRAAIARGLSVIGFSEHAEFVNEDEAYVVDNYPGDELVADIERLRGIYYRKLEILFGVEVGFLPGMEDDMKRFISRYPFDYVIGSVHYVDGMLVSRWTRERESAGADFMPYFRIVLAAARSGLFDILGHLDYVRKYISASENYDREKYEGIVGRILDAAVKQGLVLEINTSGWRHATEEAYPDRRILERFAGMGGMVTIGADAHKSSEVAYANGRARKLLAEVGFTEVQIFRQRKRFPIKL